MLICKSESYILQFLHSSFVVLFLHSSYTSIVPVFLHSSCTSIACICISFSTSLVAATVQIAHVKVRKDGQNDELLNAVKQVQKGHLCYSVSTSICL